jgi:tetratricopeptide (TPR) repeat protein
VYQAEAQAGLVKEARQDYGQLVAETRRLTNSIGRQSRLKSIAESLMQIGMDDEALEILEGIPESPDWDVVLIQAPIDAIYARRAEALARRGEIEAALETVQHIQRDYETAAPLIEIAVAQFRAGRVEAAFRTARKVRDDYQTGDALRRLAGMQARSGQVAEARRWAARETPARVKAACLRAIAEALVDGD